MESIRGGEGAWGGFRFGDARGNFHRLSRDNRFERVYRGRPFHAADRDDPRGLDEGRHFAGDRLGDGGDDAGLDRDDERSPRLPEPRTCARRDRAVPDVGGDVRTPWSPRPRGHEGPVRGRPPARLAPDTRSPVRGIWGRTEDAAHGARTESNAAPVSSVDFVTGILW